MIQSKGISVTSVMIIRLLMCLISETFKITSIIEFVLFPFFCVEISLHNYGYALKFRLDKEKNNFANFAELILKTSLLCIFL